MAIRCSFLLASQLGYCNSSSIPFTQSRSETWNLGFPQIKKKYQSYRKYITTIRPWVLKYGMSFARWSSNYYWSSIKDSYFCHFLKIPPFWLLAQCLQNWLFLLILYRSDFFAMAFMDCTLHIGIIAFKHPKVLLDGFTSWLNWIFLVFFPY